MMTTTFWYPITFALFFLAVERISGAGKWGDKGQFDCYCKGRCDKNFGYCDKPWNCEDKWTGPRCNHYNLITTTTISNIPGLLLDGNITTCVPSDQFPDTFKLVAKHYFFFKWVRFVSEGPLSELTLRIIRDGSIWNVELVRVEEEVNVYFFYSHLATYAEKLEIGIPDKKPSLCEIQLSSGYNVAALKPTSESDLDSPDHENSLAVDGDRNTCVRTKPDSEGWLDVHLVKNTYISDFRLFGDKDEALCELHPFSIHFYDQDNTAFYVYNSTETSYQIMQAPLPVRRVRVQLRQGENKMRDWCHPFGRLALCEIELIGVTDCDGGTYGPNCNTACELCVGECHPVLGCLSQECYENYRGPFCECSPKHYGGPDCKKECNSCLGGICDPNGKCAGLFGAKSRCLPGFTGEFCDKNCPIGRYGEGCSKHCDLRCILCDPINGTCPEASKKELEGIDTWVVVAIAILLFFLILGGTFFALSRLFPGDALSLGESEQVDNLQQQEDDSKSESVEPIPLQSSNADDYGKQDLSQELSPIPEEGAISDGTSGNKTASGLGAILATESTKDSVKSSVPPPTEHSTQKSESHTVT